MRASLFGAELRAQATGLRRITPVAWIGPGALTCC